VARGNIEVAHVDVIVVRVESSSQSGGEERDENGKGEEKTKKRHTLLYIDFRWGNKEEGK